MPHEKSRGGKVNPRDGFRGLLVGGRSSTVAAPEHPRRRIEPDALARHAPFEHSQRGPGAAPASSPPFDSPGVGTGRPEARK
jgi:hypothetical protein